MPDGGTALFTYNHTTQTWERVKGQTRDSNNNIVPETAADVSGGPGNSVTYMFGESDSDMIAFIQRLNRLGVRITGPFRGRGITCVTNEKETFCSGG